MDTTHHSGPVRAGIHTTVFLTELTGTAGPWLGNWLRTALSVDLRPLADIDDLPAALRALVRDTGDRPALVVVTTEGLDETLLGYCRRLRRLADEGRVGLILVTDAVPSDATVQEVVAAGGLDVIPAAVITRGGGQARLQLAARLLKERHLRLARERMFRAQLARRRVMEARLNYAATHDELTDLANRRAFEKALDLAITQGRVRQYTHALLYLDLDRFKLHNEAAGHGAGDRLLQAVANVLRGALPSEYLLARLGSDEFAILVQGTDDAEAGGIAETLRAAVAAIEPDGRQIVYHVGVSIGLTLLPPAAVASASEALAQAEQACFIAKSCGGNGVHRFSADDELLAQQRDDMRWSPLIRRTLRENRFFLMFQPVLTVADGRVSHFEALIRMPQDIGGGACAGFIPAAERLGLARQIDLWVVNRAFDFLACHGDISLGVNLSSHAFQEADLLPLVRGRLEAMAIAPERLTFEITETAAVVNFAETRRLIAELRAMGCRFALDDFGSGFSSYSYLKQFPVDQLKIDGSFIVGIRQDRRDRVIVQSMVDIGHSLDKSVVAEFIEDEATLMLLAEMGIDYAQGYFIGRPTMEPAARTSRNQEDTQ